jgi:hypothetical protein
MIASHFPRINVRVTTRLLIFFLFLASHSAIADSRLQVGETRNNSLYIITASFDTPLSKCEAFNFLTDYGAAKELPGIIESVAHRISPDEVTVERTAVEEILFFHVRLHSVLKYTERPGQGVSFSQLSGDSKIYRGSWEILPNRRGSTLKFRGLWEPDTLIPDFVIEHFAKTELSGKFGAVARLAEKPKYRQASACRTHGPKSGIATMVNPAGESGQIVQ